MNVFTLKELEKSLPGVSGINAMQVKDVLQALQDENLIRVEKIGSGNWYWSFNSDGKKTKENMINKLQAEESEFVASIAGMERQIEEEMAKREDTEMLEGNGMGRKSLLEAHDALLKEMGRLEKELACYSDIDPAEMLRKMEETKKLKASAHIWTDNLEALQCMLQNVINDRAEVGRHMARACGDEYEIGEGLRDLWT